MKKLLLGFILASTLALGGCNMFNKALDTVAPNQINSETNQEIIGSHELTPIASGIVAGASGAAAGVGFPFVLPIVSLLLLIINFFQKSQNGKLSDAIYSTVKAIENASNDPELAPLMDKLKSQLATAHQIADVQPIINSILAELKMLPTK
jgi:hypothetical protein